MQPKPGACSTRRRSSSCDASSAKARSAPKYAVNDCRKTYEDLKAKGVEFLAPPEEKFYGVEAMLKDDSGNWFSMTQPHEQQAN